LIVTVSVYAEESSESKEFGENGIGLLKRQAHALRSARRAEKDREWQPVDKVFKDMTADPDAEKEEDEEESKELKQTPKELGFPTYDENGLPDLNLVQESAADWVPKGQDDLSSAVQAAHAEDSQDLLASDDLKGDHLLSSAGIEGDDSEEADPNSSDFGDLNLVQEASSEWVPKGQPGMKQQIDDLKSKEQESQLKDDGLKGRTVLSSVGMKGDKEDPLEFEFVQDDSEWTPKNSLSQQVEQIKQEDQKEKLKSDGLKGDSVLGSVGLDDDSKDENGDQFLNLVQQWQPKPLLEHKAAPAPVKAQKPLEDQDDDEEYVDEDESSDEEQAEEYDKLGEESMGTDILGAGNMDHAKRKDHDSLAEVGALTLDDLKL
jgi:hypothetical protein